MRIWPFALMIACEHPMTPEHVVAPPLIVEIDSHVRVTQRDDPPPAIELPAPPARGVSYASYLRSLTPAQERGMFMFCTKHAYDYQRRCGGIGPLHIPVHPRIIFNGRRHDFEAERLAFERYEASLTLEQRQYIAEHCTAEEGQLQLCGELTPLVVSLDERPLAFMPGAQLAVIPGHPVAIDRPSAPWLALDRDGDGAITSAAELFGNHTEGMHARNGFDALAALDTNHDGRIDRGDPAFARLVLWTDRDGDGTSSPDELSPLSDAVDEISLDAHLDVRCDARGNCEGERSTLRTPAGRSGAVVDVYLR